MENNELSKEVSEAGALDHCLSLLGHRNMKVLKEVCCIFRLFAANNCFSSILNYPIYLEKIVFLMNSDSTNEKVTIYGYFVFPFFFRSKPMW